ncbi:MAG: hypothetical protein SPM02_07745 [Bacteroidales bacterium]|jgi:hypothetical protein|nr:hypothetical protein [Bacteroidales bacterium]
MSITILNEIDKAKVLVDGMRKNLDKAKQLGIDAPALDRLEKAFTDLKIKDDELDALRRRATLKVKENNELLADMKEQMLSMRKAVKQNYPQQEWMSFGVQDKR